MNDLHLPVSILALQKKAKSLKLPHNPCFAASRGWVRQFKERHSLALRKKTSLCRKHILFGMRQIFKYRKDSTSPDR